MHYGKNTAATTIFFFFLVTEMGQTLKRIWSSGNYPRYFGVIRYLETYSKEIVLTESTLPKVMWFFVDACDAGGSRHFLVQITKLALTGL